MVGKPKSCSACRQAKTACDARKNAPSPCSRCSEKELSCRFDRNFKRVSQRQISRDIANGVHIVRRPPNGAVAVAAANDHAGPVQANSNVEQVILESMGSEGSSFQLGDFSVSSAVVGELFEHFKQHYSVHAPFLRPIISLDRLASSSPLLFWTINLISCQHHNRHNGLYTQLLLAHRELLLSLSTRPIRSLQEIHALLLLSLWSLPSRIPVLDPTWTYVSIAVDTCVKMNFHKPLLEDHVAHGWATWLHASEDATVQDQHLTWLACFSISTQASMYQGILPPLSSSHQLKYVKKAIKRLGPCLSPEHQASLAIFECICNYSISLDDIEDSNTQLALIETFETHLDAVEQMYGAHLTPELDIQLQYAKLNLYAMVPIESSQAGSQGDIQSVVTKQALLIRGLETASRVVKRVKELSLLPANDGLYNAGKLSLYPRQYVTNMFFAAIYLFRMLVDCRPLNQTQIALTLQSIAEARDIFSLMPHHRTATTGADFLDRVLDKAQTIDASSSVLSIPQLLITNRLGASLLYDILFRMRFFASKKNSVVPQNHEGTASSIRTETHLTPEVGSQSLDVQQVPFNASLIPHPGDSYWFSWDAFFNDIDLDFNQDMCF
ncbi:hypothetical protein F4677DRAFT_409609 [Hypoxylon crocopeplum]|nr:hypothetical protein F4677DRAFT_409609 [Hypoxylon crocopeplum]